jgi:hypothetical protein
LPLFSLAESPACQGVAVLLVVALPTGCGFILDITISRAEKLLGVTYKAAQQNIEKLETAGILRETTKKQRNRVYIAQGIMDLLDEQDLPPDKNEEQTP